MRKAKISKCCEQGVKKNKKRNKIKNLGNNLFNINRNPISFTITALTPVDVYQ
jgi:hypothetical protein